MKKIFLALITMLAASFSFAEVCKKTVINAAIEQHNKDGGYQVYQNSVSLISRSGDTLTYVVELKSAISYGGDQGADFFTDRYYITATGPERLCNVTKIKHTLSRSY